MTNNNNDNLDKEIELAKQTAIASINKLSIYCDKAANSMFELSMEAERYADELRNKRVDLRRND